MERENTYFGRQEDVMQVTAGGSSTALLLTDGRVMTMGQYTVISPRINMNRIPTSVSALYVTCTTRLSGG